jgi:hypothetical protein
LGNAVEKFSGGRLTFAARRLYELFARGRDGLGGASLRFLQGCGFFLRFGPARLWSNSKENEKEVRSRSLVRLLRRDDNPYKECRNALSTDYVTWSVSSKRIEREVHEVAYMKPRHLLMLLALSVFAISGAICGAASVAFGQTQKPLTNADVASMTKQGLDSSLIVKDIEGSSSDFDISPQALIDLKNAGVDKSVMDAMLSAQARKPVAAVEAVHGAATPSDAARGGGPSADLSKPMCSDNGSCLLREGTQVPLKFLAELSSKTANEGDPVEFVLDDDLKVGDSIVVAKGAHALATVTSAKKAGMMGKGGELSVQIEYLIAGSNHVRMRGTKGREGDSKTGATVALTVLFGPIGLIKHGKNVDIAAGTPFAAYVDQDVWLALVR